MPLHRHILRRSTATLAATLFLAGVGGALGADTAPSPEIYRSFAGAENPFLPSCEASPVQKLEEEGGKKGKKPETYLFLSTRCGNGETAFWRCKERDELGATLIDCNEERSDDAPGRRMRITQTGKARLGAVLCGMVCR